MLVSPLVNKRKRRQTSKSAQREALTVTAKFAARNRGDMLAARNLRMLRMTAANVAGSMPWLGPTAAFLIAPWPAPPP
jgi:hypothetical protein